MSANVGSSCASVVWGAVRRQLLGRGLGKAVSMGQYTVSLDVPTPPFKDLEINK